MRHVIPTCLSRDLNGGQYMRGRWRPSSLHLPKLGLMTNQRKRTRRGGKRGSGGGGGEGRKIKDFSYQRRKWKRSLERVN